MGLREASCLVMSGGAGEMAEWLKAHAWKACVRESVPRVRIPVSPPDIFLIPLIPRRNFLTRRARRLNFSRKAAKAGDGQATPGSRAKRIRAVESCHAPPRAVRMPRALSASAMARPVATPDACIVSVRPSRLVPRPRGADTPSIRSTLRPGLRTVADGSIEIITGRGRRRRWSVSEKLGIVAESHEPGAQVAGFAARHDIARACCTAGGVRCANGG